MAKAAQSDPLNVLLTSKPYTLDPLHYDVSVHHITGKPILTSLVSQYSTGKISGIIAESWTNNSEMTQWRFKIRDNMTFSNGDPITPSRVVASLNRITWLLKRRGSEDDLVEYFIGSETMTNASSDFSGIKVEGEEVVLNFRSPRPKLLESISFGTYGIVHSSNFDPQGGEWRNAESAIASGAYEVAAWEKDRLSLALRADFPKSLRHQNAAREINLYWDASLVTNPHIIVGSSLSTQADYEFMGSGAQTSSMWYMHLFGWNSVNSVLSSRECRIHLRSAFYHSLKTKGFKPTYSFLPLAISGIREAEIKDTKKSEKCGGVESFLLKASKLPERKYSHFLHEAFGEAVISSGGNYEAIEPPAIEALLQHLDGDPATYIVDAHAMNTGILLEAPEMDMRFMVKSKEGIRLPDPTGRLREVVSKDKIDAAKFNEILWDDAIIWPITHFVYGLWVEKGKIDYSQINLSLPPSDLSFIGVNP